MTDAFDHEVRAFVLDAKAGAWSELASLVEQKFGRERAWPLPLIKAVRMAVARPANPPLSKDAEIRAFVADRMYLVTLDDIVTEGLRRFGRFPSRTAVGRMAQEMRAEAMIEASALLGHAKH